MERRLTKTGENDPLYKENFDSKLIHLSGRRKRLRRISVPFFIETLEKWNV